MKTKLQKHLCNDNTKVVDFWFLPEEFERVKIIRDYFKRVEFFEELFEDSEFSNDFNLEKSESDIKLFDSLNKRATVFFYDKKLFEEDKY